MNWMDGIKRFSTVFLVLIFSTSLLATELWMPVTIIVSPSGSISQLIPLPVDGNPGPSAGSNLGGGFFPVIGGNITHFTRIFAITPSQSSINVSNLSSSQEFSLLPEKSALGYRVITQDNKSLTIAGAATMGPGGWLALNATLAVGITAGKGYLASRSVKTLAEAKKLPSPKIPNDIPNYIQQLNPGDSLSFSTSGSLFANLSAGAGWLINVGVGYSVNGSWSVTLGRPENDSNKNPSVILSYTKDKSHGGNVNIGNLFTSVSASFLMGKSNSFKYKFDLTNLNATDAEIAFHPNDPLIKKMQSDSKLNKMIRPINLNQRDIASTGGKLNNIPLQGFVLEKATALQAYQLALKGNLILADFLSQAKGKYGVTKITEEESRYKKANLGVGVKVPWLISANWNWGKAYIVNDLKNFDEDTAVETVNGIYSKEFSTSGILSNDAKRSSLFTGFVQQIMPLDQGFAPPNTFRRYAANWKYSYQRNNVDKEKMLEELKQVRYRIGFQSVIKGDLIDQLYMSQGNDRDVKMKNKSFNVEVDIALSNIATDELMNIAEKYDEKTFVNEAESYLDGFVNTYKNEMDKDDYSTAKKELCIGGAGHKARVLAECIFTTRNQTKSAMKTAYNALIKMKQFKANGDYKHFVSAYADFGKGFIENRFTMKTFLRMLRYVCTPATYQKLVKANPNASNEDILKVCPEKRVLVDGKPSKVPYVVKMKVQGTSLKTFDGVLYSHNN